MVLGKAKRKSLPVTNGESEAPVTSKKRKRDMTWLTNGLRSSDPISVVKQFNEAVELFNKTSEDDGAADVVQEFFQTDCTGQEFLAVLEGDSKRKKTEISCIFTSLEYLFDRVSSDLSEYRDVAMRTASRILQNHLPTIYLVLEPKSSAYQAKGVLRLLTSMVMLGHVTAREVITCFDFTHEHVTHALTWKCVDEQPDVRSTYLMFITAFLMEDDSMLLRTMGENPAILRPIFEDLVHDTAGVVNLFLTALRDKLVSSTLLSKTLKLHIFNAYTVQQLARLFTWQGPVRKPKKDKDEAKVVNMDAEEREELQLAVAELVQSLLLLLSTSHKHGIAFADYTIGLAASNKNFAVFSLLEALGNFWEQPSERIVELQTELVVKALQSCPDLIRNYLRSIADDLSLVRASPAWIKLCSLVRQIVDAQNLTIIFNPKEKHSVRQQSLRATSLIVPSTLNEAFFVKGLNDADVKVKLATEQILHAVLAKAIEFRKITSYHEKAVMYTEPERASIFSHFRDSLKRAVPASLLMVQSCTKSPVIVQSKDCAEYWIVLLEVLALYAKLEFVTPQDEAQIPGTQLVNNVFECIDESTTDAGFMERLRLAVFTFLLSSSDINNATKSQLKVLVPQLASCLIEPCSLELRQCAAALLFQIIKKSGEASLTQLEFNVWTSALERHPDAAGFFADTCSTLLNNLASFQNELEEMFDTQDFKRHPLGSPLMQPAWKCFIGKDRMAHVALYMSAVTCELVLCQEGDAEQIATNLLKHTPKKLLGPSLKAYLKTWVKTNAKRPEEIDTLGLSSLAAILYNSAFFDQPDWESLTPQWNDEINSIKERTECLEMALCFALTCLRAAIWRKLDPINILGFLKVILEQDHDVGSDLHTKFLQYKSTLEWFDPLKLKDPFVDQFNLLVRDALHRIRDADVSEPYRLKLTDCVGRVVRGELGVKGKEKEQMLNALSELKVHDKEPDIHEIELLITSMVQQKKTAAVDTKLRYLDMFLQRAARCRIRGPSQRISWSTFSQVLQLFVALKAPVALQKGIYELLSVCPEFLDSIDEFTEVLNACLDSESDSTTLCLLLVTSSSSLSAAFGNWCLENEKQFENITWRLQLLPAYLSSNPEEKVVQSVHRNLFLVLKTALTNSAEYQEALDKISTLPDILRVVVSKCWEVADCRSVTEVQMSKSKSGVKCAQFATVCRHGAKDMLVKLAMRQTVIQLKCESPETIELEQLSEEFDWLSKQTRAEISLPTKKILSDSTWTKFVKYTLRTGLETSESSHPVLALRCFVAIWRILRGDPSEDLTGASQTVWEMVTSHSDFATVLMDEEGAYAEQKRLLVELMTVLVQVNPKLCQAGQVPIILASYGATRSPVDLLLFGLVRSYEKNGVIMDPYKPFVWGPAAASYYSIQRGAATRLLKQTEAGEVLALLDSEKLLRTAYNYPVYIKFDKGEAPCDSGDYDPRFLLSVLVHILSSEYAIQCLKFTQSGAVSLLLASLSSACEKTRTLGWLALSRLAVQLKNATAWPERVLWLHLIECVRLGTAELLPEKPGVGIQYPPKLSSIITLFLAKTAAIMRDPLHPMYRTVNNFLALKSTLDVNQVPEFFVMLHSTDLPDQRTLLRTFLLNLVRDGLRSQADYLVCARRRVFRVILSLQPSSLLADQSTKSMVLEVVHSAVRHPIIAYDLIRNRGLIMWLDGLLLADKVTTDADQILKIVETLWSTLYAHLEKRKNASSDEEEIAKLKREMEALEAEEDETEPIKAVEEIVEETAIEKPAVDKKNQTAKKPQAVQLPVIAPYIMCDLVQLLVNLWQVLYDAEVSSTAFESFTKVFCAVATHLHETRVLMEKDSQKIKFVAPYRTLSLPLLRQLLETADRFVSDLPDLKDHLIIVETSKTKNGHDPVGLARKWQQRHEAMRKLVGQEEPTHLIIRQNLHMLLSLAECGV